MKNKANNKQSKFMQIILSPIKILCKARDLYVKSLEDCAGRVGHEGMVICPTAQVVDFPKGFSAKSFNKRSDQEEEFRELLRAASRKNVQKQTTSQNAGVERSYSVGVGKIGRIDEDEPCAFMEYVSKAELLYPRCRSKAVGGNFVYA